MSNFDPQTFLDSNFEGSNSTSRTPCPEGEYPAVIKDVEVNAWTSRDQTKSGLRLDVRYSIDDESVKAAVGLPEPTVRQGLMLDLTPSGGLDMGKGRNIGLGRLREATRLNDPAKPFNFRMLVGQMVKVKVTHRVADEAIYDEVKAVAPL